ncbi:hypothetical protein BS17DRAFT_524962 [Gyrodon lividus]|nr:hypothetical protein BS17DRAFT_524962 [Gyrodon lividus]
MRSPKVRYRECLVQEVRVERKWAVISVVKSLIRYGICSHRWSDDEVTCQKMMEARSRRQLMRGSRQPLVWSQVKQALRSRQEYCLSVTTRMQWAVGGRRREERTRRTRLTPGFSTCRCQPYTEKAQNVLFFRPIETMIQLTLNVGIFNSAGEPSEHRSSHPRHTVFAPMLCRMPEWFKGFPGLGRVYPDESRSTHQITGQVSLSAPA